MLYCRLLDGCTKIRSSYPCGYARSRFAYSASVWVNVKRYSLPPARNSSSSSSKRWQSRNVNDKYTREARVLGLKSRAAFKLLEVLYPDPASRLPAYQNLDQREVQDLQERADGSRLGQIVYQSTFRSPLAEFFRVMRRDHGHKYARQYFTTTRLSLTYN